MTDRKTDRLIEDDVFMLRKETLELHKIGFSLFLFEIPKLFEFYLISLGDLEYQIDIDY